MGFLAIIGAGRLPAEVDALIPAAERLISCEFLSCSIIMRDFHHPNGYSGWKQQWFAGSIAMSENKLIAFRRKRRLICVSVDDPRFGDVTCAATGNQLRVSHDASLFRHDLAGALEYRFKTPEAKRIVELLSRYAVGNHCHT